MMFWYRSVLSPLLLIVFLVAQFASKKIRYGIRLRTEAYPPEPPKIRPLWIHAASGEFEYAKPVIRRFKALNPQIPILVTYFSPTYRKNIENCPGVDFSRALPFDFPGPLQQFLKFYQPRLCLIARTDLWPEMLTQTKQFGIPSVLFSATQASKPWIVRSMKAFVLRKLDMIFCVSPEDAQELKRLTPKGAIFSIGDTRYDQVFERLKNPKKVTSLRSSIHAPLLIAGSTWPEDETVLMKGLAPQLKNKGLRLALVPHEPTPEHVKQLITDFAQLNIATQLYSEFRADHEWAVVIVDRVGVLAELYTQGDIAFVGGSFKRSVHSVMEPLAAGLFVCVGPHHHNNREALEFKNIFVNDTACVETVKSAEDIEVWIRNVISHIAHSKDQICKETKKRQGATDSLVKVVSGLCSTPETLL